MRLRSDIARASRSALAALISLAVGCVAPHAVYRDAFEGTRGALDALNRAGPDAIDPAAIRAASQAATEGARVGLDLPQDVDAWAAVAARHAAAGAVMGAADGLSSGLSGQLTALVDALLLRLVGDGEHPGALARALDQATPRVEGLTTAELRILRREWSAMLRDTRIELRGVTRDLDADLQSSLRTNGRVMGETLRDQVLPAVGRGLADNMAPAVSQITEAAAMGATRGLQRGLREDIAPAAIELRDAVIHGPRSTTHAIWALFALVVVLLAGITTIAGMAWRYFRRVMRRARSGTGSRRRSITALKIRRVTRRHGTATT